MKFSLNWLKEFVDIKESPEKLAELLTLKSFEVGEWRKVKDDVILDIDILPNRSDALSHYGLAKEIAALIPILSPTKSEKQNRGSSIFQPNHFLTKLGNDLGKIGTEYKIKGDKGLDINKLLNVKVENYDLCPRYTAGVITDVKVGKSPSWLKDRLNLLGLQSINNIVDATNYVMLELGQPLHAFDFDKLTDSRSGKKEIIVKTAKDGEKLRALDEAGTEHILDKDILTIRDNKGAMAIAGIKGGRGTEIQSSTKNIAIESANFNPSNIRKSSKKLNLTTDASLRFSYGVDFNLTSIALTRVTGLIQELAGGKIAKGVVDEYSQKPVIKTVVLEKEYITRLSGVKIPDKTSLQILTSLGFKVQDKKNKFIITVPSFRLDISIPEDVIEEIVRVYGYENIKFQSPLVGAFTDIPFSRGEHLAKFKETELWDFVESIRFRDLTRNILNGLGLTEVYNYSFVSDEDKELYGYRKLIEIQNPISHYARYLRPNLITNLLKVSQSNLKFFQDVRLFEIGRVFMPDETRRLAGVIAVKKGKKVFFELKGLIDSFLNSLGVAGHRYDDITSWHRADRYIFHPGISAEIKLNDEVLGIMGEISPNVLFSLDKGLAGVFRSAAVAGFEFNFKKLISLVQSEREFEPIAKFPAIVRDISLLVNKDVRISQILNSIESADTKRIVQDVDVFDIYEDDPSLPEGKKSVALHVIYQSNERTLRDKEVNEIENNIKGELEKRLGAEIR